MIEIISATRLSQTEFWSKAALAFSLQRILPDAKSFELLQTFEPATVMRAHIAFDNSGPLANVYNERILADEPDAVLVFIHDDVWIEDFFIGHRLIDGLAKYDVIGIAGVRVRAPRQTGWAFDGDIKTLSGRVANGSHPFGGMTYFGPTPQQCELLDGVCLAARRSTLKSKGVLFDPQFDFHFYDLDFCRSATARGLRLGTWPIAITHQSPGSGVRTEHWQRKRDLYLAKWPD